MFEEEDEAFREKLAKDEEEFLKRLPTKDPTMWKHKIKEIEKIE